MSYAAEMQLAAREAQNILAQIQGMDADAAGNFLGPDGRTYTMTFRSADAFETEAIGREMQSHGFEEKSVIIGAATRDQFDAPPIGWRAQKATRLVPTPVTDVTIVSVATDDPLFYVFPMIVRRARNG